MPPGARGGQIWAPHTSKPALLSYFTSGPPPLVVDQRLNQSGRDREDSFLRKTVYSPQPLSLFAPPSAGGLKAITDSSTVVGTPRLRTLFSGV